MTCLLLPTVLRQHCDGLRSVDVLGGNVAEAMQQLTEKHPGLREPLLADDGSVRNYVNVFVNDENIRDLQHEQTPVTERDEIVIVPALAGG